MSMGGGGGGGTTAGAKVFLPPNQEGAAQGFQNLIQPMYNQSLNQLQQLDQLGTPAGLAYPQIKDSAFNIVNNPYQNQAIDAATTASQSFQNEYSPYIRQGIPQMTNLAGLGQDAASSLMSAANNPAYGAAGQMGAGLSNIYAGAVPGTMSSAGRILDTAFDPQNKLYDRTAQQLQDQLGAFSGGTGTSGSPYAAGLASDSLKNFNIDWQNNQLNRQVTGAQGAGSLFNSAEGLGKAGQSSLLTPANAAVAAQAAGSQGLGSLGSMTDNLYSTGGNLLNNLAQGTASYGALPYNTYNTTQNADLQAMQQLISLGNYMYQPGQQVISDLSGYMGLGQNASQLANTIGNTNFNQQMQGMQGLGSLGLGATNTLFGGGGSSGGLLGGGGGLFGGLGGLFGGGADASAASTFGGGAGIFDAFAASPEMALAFAL